MLKFEIPSMMQNQLGLKSSAIVALMLINSSFLSAQLLNEADILLQPTELLNATNTGMGFIDRKKKNIEQWRK